MPAANSRTTFAARIWLGAACAQMRAAGLGLADGAIVRADAFLRPRARTDQRHAAVVRRLGSKPAVIAITLDGVER